MSNRPIKCVQCKKPAPYRFCSNECFRAYSRRRKMVDCSVCRYDEKTDTVGNIRSNRICAECAKDPANSGWTDGSRRERKGFDLDEFAAGAQQLDVRIHIKFNTPLALKVVRLVAAGQTHSQIANSEHCSIQYVKAISTHWSKETNKLLKDISKENKKAAKNDG